MTDFNEAVRLAGSAEGAAPPISNRSDRLFAHFMEQVERIGLLGGTVLEIGGRKNSIRPRLPEGFELFNLDLEEKDNDGIVGDITNCPQIPSESFDVIYSVDVFEHINRPWLAAAEITRLLRPRGMVYTSTLFSWRYHPCPIDYWRFTPDCLEFLFADLATLDKGFDSAERRRDLLGQGRYKLVPDDLGGWRENWRVFHIGQKPWK